MDWQDVESRLENLDPVGGGFSQAQRGLVILPDDNQVFVKIGRQENTKRWAKKEIAVYRFLHKHGYPYVPELLAVNPDETGFALTALTWEDGWDWQDNWNDARLAATLDAMDALAAIEPQGTDYVYFSDRELDESADGWVQLAESTDLQATLRQKLEQSGRVDIASTLDIAAQAKQSKAFVFNNNALIHNDVRADNAAWNPSLGKVKLIDWNWTQLGDRRIDLAATLVHVHMSGLDVSKKYQSRLDSDALHWVAGFWFKSAATPIWAGGPAHLRDIQLQSGITALSLAKR